MGTTRHFHVAFDVRVLNFPCVIQNDLYLNLSNRHDWLKQRLKALVYSKSEVLSMTSHSLRAWQALNFMGGLICSGQDFGGHGGGPHKIEGLPRRLDLALYPQHICWQIEKTLYRIVEEEIEQCTADSSQSMKCFPFPPLICCCRSSPHM